jgi:hypothetical protein
MTHLTWADDTPVNPTNLNKMAQNVDFQPGAAVAFAGSSGRTITHNYGHTDYMLMINPVEDTEGYLGDVWITKAANTAVVYNSGDAVTDFEYVITPHE